LLAVCTLGCNGEPSTTTTDENPAGALTGQLTAVSILDAQGSPSMSYFLTPAGASSPVRLLFATDPNLTSSTQVRVWGHPEGDGFRVDRQLVLPDTTGDEPGVVRRALIGQASTNVTVAWVQMDVNGGGVNQTSAAAQSLIFAQNPGPLFGTKAGDKSVAQYYAENSYGMVNLVGQVEGPIPFTGTACNNFDPLAMNVVSQVTAMGRTYQHYYLYWGSEQACGPGWGAQGTSVKPGKYVWLNNDGTFCTATGQELGHNFGLMHASTMKCTGATIANDTSACTSNEYGNPMTVMGGGCRHLMSVEKWYSGFFKSCNAVKLKTSGTFTLLPIEIPCGGIQALQIPMPAAAPVRTTTTSQSNGNVTMGFYYLELRGGQGMDTGMKTGVYVHAAADIPAPTQNGARTFLLDMNPATTAWDPMTVGQTFTDPAGGVSFTLNSADTSSASVTVTITGGTGDNTCVDGTTLEGSGPATCGSGPDGGTSTGSDSGTTGAGGATGTGGRAGTGGSSGTGGRGTGGALGAGGAPGAGGATGAGGSSTGAGGSTAGAGGTSSGAGGSATGAGGSPGGDLTNNVTGGCACDLGAPASGSASMSHLGLLLGGVALLVARRRRR
jgi:MYXO-CTERM domain-containing protein